MNIRNDAKMSTALVLIMNSESFNHSLAEIAAVIIFILAVPLVIDVINAHRI